MHFLVYLCFVLFLIAWGIAYVICRVLIVISFSGDMFSRILFLTTYCLVVVQVAAVNVRFLGSVARFRNSSRLDYYYICRTCGQTIQWEVNMADGPSHFETDKIGQVRFRADSTGDDINYLSILLLRTNTNNEMCLTALLVVSRLSSEPVSIVCRGDTSQKMAGNNPTSTFLSDKAIEGDVRIDYLFYDDDIISEHTSTYRTFIFICNVNGTSQFWMAGTDSIGGFVLNNDVGLDAIQRNRNDADIAYTVAVLIARQLIQRTLTSILVLLEENYTRNFSVSCRSDTTELSLPVIYSLSRNTDNMGLMSTTMNSINEVSTSLSSFSSKFI